MLLAAAALALQLSGPGPFRPVPPPDRSIVPSVLGPQSQSAETPAGVLWREFLPGQHLVEAPSGWICGAALRRGTGAATLILRFCGDIPTTPLRRFGLGYDSLVIEASLPVGRLSYSLLDFEGPEADRGRSFMQGPTRENTVPVRDVFVRDATDVIVILGTDLPAGLPSVGVHGSFHGRAFAETRAFEPLGSGPDANKLELEHSLSAPSWAAEAP